METGEPQGGSESGPFYTIYNAPLAEIPKKQLGEMGALFADDANFLAEGDTVEEAVEKIRDMMTQRGGILDWGRRHSSQLAMDKSFLMCFTRKREVDEDGRAQPIRPPPLVINGTEIPLVRHTRFLGVILNNQLRHHQQVNKALEKGLAYVTQIRRLARTTRE